MDIIILAINGFEEKAKKEKKLPAYVVPFSNFSDGNAFVYGIPCKVIEEAGDNNIVVMSLITGIKYTIPKSWNMEYDNDIDAIRASSIESSTCRCANPQLINIIGKKYYPKDNSYIADFEGKWASLIGETVTIISLPFDETIKNPFGKSYTRKMVLVEHKGKVYRTLFEEWSFFPKTNI